MSKKLSVSYSTSRVLVGIFVCAHLGVRWWTLRCLLNQMFAFFLSVFFLRFFVVVERACWALITFIFVVSSCNFWVWFLKMVSEVRRNA